MIKDLVEIFDVKRDTIGRWRKEWESQRKVLMRKGRGRKETLSDEIQEEIHSLVKEYPNNIKIVHQMVEEKHNIKFSIDTLRRVIKKNSNLNV
jgi:transposase